MMIASPEQFPSETPQDRGHGSTRIPSLDTLRGLLLVLMAMNHVPSDLRRVTDQPLGFVSAAEGFVFLSGLLAGKVYSSRARARGGLAAARAAVARAFVIYRAHLICVALVAAWCWSYAWLAGAPAPGAPPRFAEAPLASVVAGALLVYRPGLLDILPLYCAALLVLAVIVAPLQRGRVAVVLLGSGLCWLGANLFGARAPYVQGVINTGAIAISAWQFLFVLGCVLGSRWAAGKTVVPVVPRAVVVVLAGLAIGLAAVRHGVLPLPQLTALWLTDKRNLAPLRMIDMLLVAYLLARVLRAYPRALSFAPLTFLGQHSLPVFTAHVIGATVVLGLPAWFDGSVPARALGMAFLFAVMFSTAYVSAQRSREPAPVMRMMARLRPPSGVPFDASLVPPRDAAAGQ